MAVEMTLWEPFITWQFGVASVVIVAVMTTVKRTIRAGRPELLDRRPVKAVLTVGNLVLGFGVAAPPGFLAGEGYTQRVLTGICAGFLSHFVYHSILKRFTSFSLEQKDGTHAPLERKTDDHTAQE